MSWHAAVRWQLSLIAVIPHTNLMWWLLDNDWVNNNYWKIFQSPSKKIGMFFRSCFTPSLPSNHEVMLGMGIFNTPSMYTLLPSCTSHRGFSATSFPWSLFSASLSCWNRDPGCGSSRDHLSIQNRRVGGYSSAFGREDDKIPPGCPTLPADFSTTQILVGHVTSRNQGLCSND